jgi:two-component system secretion response regulator SsrB
MSEESQTIRVVIADDHPATREGIRTILSAAPDVKVAGEAENGREAQEKVAALQPQSSG